MRHAKSDWHSGASSDHERPLNKRGRRDAPRVAARLAELGWAPQHVLSSDSTRTRETLALMLDEWDPQPTWDLLPEFYHAGIEEIHFAAATVDEEIETLLVLGHNPGWQHAVTWLSSEDEPMTTANAALLQCEADTWREALAAAGAWELHEVLRPKEF